MCQRAECRPGERSAGAEDSPTASWLLPLRLHWLGRLVRLLLIVAAALSILATFAGWCILCYQPSFWVRSCERACMFQGTKLRRFDWAVRQAAGAIDAGRPLALQLAEGDLCAWLHQIVERKHFYHLPPYVRWVQLALSDGYLRMGFQDCGRWWQPVIWLRLRVRRVGEEMIEFEADRAHSGRLKLQPGKLRYYVERTHLPEPFKLVLLGADAYRCRFALRLDAGEAEGPHLRLSRVELRHNSLIIIGEPVGLSRAEKELNAP